MAGIADQHDLGAPRSHAHQLAHQARGIDDGLGAIQSCAIALVDDQSLALAGKIGADHVCQL